MFSDNEKALILLSRQQYQTQHRIRMIMLLLLLAALVCFAMEWVGLKELAFAGVALCGIAIAAPYQPNNCAALNELFPLLETKMQSIPKGTEEVDSGEPKG